MACICPYCRSPAEIVGGDIIYPHRPDLAGAKFHHCAPCSAFVGCHKAGAWTFDLQGRKVVSDGTLPLGRLANAELRKAKQLAHAAFDPLWKGGQTDRRAAYAWLAKELGLPLAACHIGEFDVKQCRAVVAACHRKQAAPARS